MGDQRAVRGRPGCSLTKGEIAHYQMIVIAFKETMRPMEETGKIIEEHGVSGRLSRQDYDRHGFHNNP